MVDAGRVGDAKQDAPRKSQPEGELPRHDDYCLAVRVVELGSLIAAAILLVWQALRLGNAVNWSSWWLAPVVMAAILAADFVSGLVHWFADTWFDESVPFLGPRFLRPFRVHHVNPADFLRRDVVDTNGDVAMLTIPILIAASWLPLDLVWGQVVGVFVVAMCAAALPTNQVHQWAHMPQPPRGVAILQRWGLILRPAAHQLHHAPPHVANYCIATGWCNPLLSAVGFFPRLERLVTRVTGLQPRHDDTAYVNRYPAVGGEASEEAA